MRITRALAPLAALTLPLLGVAAPAHADIHRSGTLTDTDPTTTLYEPVHDGDAQGCPTTTSEAATDIPVDTVHFVATATGLRDVTVNVDPDVENDVAIYLYRNGACVAADYEADNETEAAAGVLDLVGVRFKRGDRGKIVIGSFDPPLSWSVTITDPPGATTGVNIGKAKKYVMFPAAVNCTTHRTTAKLTKKARKAQGKKAVKSIVFTAAGHKLKKLKHTKGHKTVALKHVPTNAKKLTATVRLKSGKKLKVTRSYNRC